MAYAYPTPRTKDRSSKTGANGRLTRFVLSLFVLTLFALSHAGEPPEAVGSLYLKSPQKYLCTASIVAGAELGVALERVVLTAAHCVEKSLTRDPITKIWQSKHAFEVSFGGEKMFEVYPYRVGFASTGYDLAILRFVEEAPDITPLRMGAWDEVDLGSVIQNYANPMGMGLQYFTGTVTMTNLKPSPTNRKPNWHHNAVASVQVGPGSSGSLILNASQEYIGVLSSVMEAKFGSPFTIFVPQWRFDDFLNETKAGRNLNCTPCELNEQAFFARMDGAVFR